LKKWTEVLSNDDDAVVFFNVHTLTAADANGSPPVTFDANDAADSNGAAAALSTPPRPTHGRVRKKETLDSLQLTSRLPPSDRLAESASPARLFTADVAPLSLRASPACPALSEFRVPSRSVLASAAFEILSSNQLRFDTIDAHLEKDLILNQERFVHGVN